MSDYKQTRDAAGRVTSQYSQMLQNLNDDDLTRRHEHALYKIDVLEDIIEKLEAKLEKAMQVIEACEEDEGYVPRRVVSLYEELSSPMKGQNDE